MAPRRPKIAPRRAQEGPLTAPRAPKSAPRGPQYGIFEPPRGAVGCRATTQASGGRTGRSRHPRTQFFTPDPFPTAPVRKIGPGGPKTTKNRKRRFFVSSSPPGFLRAPGPGTGPQRLLKTAKDLPELPTSSPDGRATRSRRRRTTVPPTQFFTTDPFPMAPGPEDGPTGAEKRRKTGSADFFFSFVVVLVRWWPAAPQKGAPGRGWPSRKPWGAS